MKAARKGSQKREVELFFFNTVQQLLLDKVPEEIILASMVKICAVLAEQFKGGNTIGWLREAAKSFSAAADEMERAYHDAVPAIQRPKKSTRRKRKS